MAGSPFQGPWLESEVAVRGYELGPEGVAPLTSLARWLEHARWSTAESEAFAFRRFLPRGVVRAERIRSLAPVHYGERVRITSWIGRIGRTSFEFRQRARVEDTLVAVCTTTVVALGDTGPAPISEEARALVREEPLDEDPEPPTLPAAPAACFCHALTVGPSDIDLFGHMNHARWLEHAVDARFLGLAAGALPRAHPGPLRSLSADFRREARPGEPVQLFTWANGDGSVGVEARLTAGTVAARVRLEAAGAGVGAPTTAHPSSAEREPR